MQVPTPPARNKPMYIVANLAIGGPGSWAMTDGGNLPAGDVTRRKCRLLTYRFTTEKQPRVCADNGHSDHSTAR